MKDILERLQGLWAPDDDSGGEVDFSPVQGSEDYEVIVSDEAEADPAPAISKAELLEQIESQKAAIEAGKARGDEVSALRQGLAELGQNLQRPQESPKPEGAAFDEDAYRKKFNEEFYNDPYEFMQDFAMKKLAPEFQRLAGRQEVLMKREIERDPERRETYTKYRKEIDAEYEGIPAYERYSNSQAFEQAHDRVVARHINEIIELRVKEALEANESVNLTKESGKDRGNFNESGSVSSPGLPKQSRQIRLTTKESQWAKVRGLSPQKASEVLGRRPELKTAINR